MIVDALGDVGRLREVCVALDALVREVRLPAHLGVRGDEDRVLVHQREAEVAVVDQHVLLRPESLVLDDVLHVQHRVAEDRGDAPGHDHVRAEDRGLAHLALRVHDVAVVMPACAVREVLRGEVRDPSVQAKLLVPIGAGRAGVGEAAGGDEAAVEAAQPAEALRLEE